MHNSPERPGIYKPAKNIIVEINAPQSEYFLLSIAPIEIPNTLVIK